MTLPQVVRALHITGPDSFEIVEKPLPDRKPGYSYAAPAYVGLCGTDLDLFDGSMPYFGEGVATYPLQPGHEWSGTLLEANARLEPGTRMILDAVIDCGRADCELCDAGLMVRCQERFEFGVRKGLDGAMATAVAAPDRYMLPLPEGVRMRDAALVEPMVTTLEGIKRTAPVPGEEVLIVGSATLGLAGAMILGAAITVAPFKYDPWGIPAATVLLLSGFFVVSFWIGLTFLFPQGIKKISLSKLMFWRRPGP